MDRSSLSQRLFVLTELALSRLLTRFGRVREHAGGRTVSAQR